MNDCPICVKHQHQENIIYEGANWIIFNGPYESQLLGYFHLAPKRHVENWSELTTEELSQMGHVIHYVEKKLKEFISIDRLYTVTISEQVRHLHIHLIPRTVSNSVKGLKLIEQATQQTINSSNYTITRLEYNEFYKKMNDHFIE
ncbi:HIT family protein [Sutcliffiella horikoshii]|uniref:HIT family protein n=1 Tax=Sutcliffiella horikoshii TaxID=79883 RepID=UPI003CF79EF3